MGADAVCTMQAVAAASVQFSFLLFSVLCTEARKSTMSLAVFLGLSITTEWPQFSRTSTWELVIDLANMSAPDTSSTCRERKKETHTKTETLRCTTVDGFYHLALEGVRDKWKSPACLLPDSETWY